MSSYDLAEVWVKFLEQLEKEAREDAVPIVRYCPVLTSVSPWEHLVLMQPLKLQTWS